MHVLLRNEEGKVFFVRFELEILENSIASDKFSGSSLELLN